ncbi:MULTISPECIES: glycosyltransferase family 2 protein [Haloferax]|uniref:Glycosyltransferase n=2 Tax=Haloferax TaxID=2251 RepID=A0A6G1Z6K3_9EURY|nr:MULTISPECIES: glycosyltransferase family 2 protein [Haloferax]KAB1185473.1 glycosyltransferase family 2 protein [Haloferax sp. CBA1149]MRW82123.1 glycosyltransferase [Haloferax marinisediminis]
MSILAVKSETHSPLVSYVVATYNRPDDLTEAIDSILRQEYRPIEVVVISNSTDETAELFSRGGRFDLDCVKHYNLPGRMGVPEARNVGFDRASGEILVSIDDDAVLKNPNATDTIVSKFEDNPDIGILAFQSRNYFTDEINRKEIPDPPTLGMDATDEFRTAFFIGVGNAIRRSTLEKTGGYPASFVYGFEEMDLSFRTLDNGYDILYTPSVVVHHKKSPEGRRPDRETQERLVGNRIKLAFRNLPWRYVFFTTLIWSAYSLVLTKRLSSLWRIVGRLYDDRDELLNERQVIDGETIERIKSRKTMLYGWWYGPHPGRIVGPNADPRRLFWEAENI